MPGYAEPMVVPPDAELVARLRARDEATFALLLDEWSGGMTRLARTFVSTDASAAEVVQETWLAVIQGIDRFEQRSSVKTWVYRILTNTAKRRGVREHRITPMTSLTDAGPTVAPDRFQQQGEPHPGHWREFPEAWQPERFAMAAEVHTELAAPLAELPERQRVVITLRDVEGCTANEVCELLEISAANQRVLLHRARAYVRGKLEEYFRRAES